MKQTENKRKAILIELSTDNPASEAGKLPQTEGVKLARRVS